MKKISHQAKKDLMKKNQSSGYHCAYLFVPSNEKQDYFLHFSSILGYNQNLT